MRPFVDRHIGPSESDIQEMLDTLGSGSLDALMDETVPGAIRLAQPLSLDTPLTEQELLEALAALAAQNRVARSMIGMGYADCITPPVIQRNILENPGWYTQYTPYQAEISQGRLEALMNFQTMVADLTGLPLANASLLDEATAAAEAMSMCVSIARAKNPVFYVADDCHPQTIAVMRTRAKPVGIDLRVGPWSEATAVDGALVGVLLQTPSTDGRVHDHRALVEAIHARGTLAVFATDLLALTVLASPGEQGADIAIGSSQRFGVALGAGGPHAAFMATRNEHKRHIPGRVVGVSRDAEGRSAYRLALQTREQHIRRERATSNICTAQVLLAIMASMYAVYHGPRGLKAIAERVHQLTLLLAAGLRQLGFARQEGAFFDTLRVSCSMAEGRRVLEKAEAQGYNLRAYPGGDVGVAFDETTRVDDVIALLEVFADQTSLPFAVDALACEVAPAWPLPLQRQTPYLTHEVFHQYQTEHEMLRYLHRLESRDLSLTTAMIPLGSCTMKLNASAQMAPVTWPGFARIHPFAPTAQVPGYLELFQSLERWLSEITGFFATSLQPNAGSQGEYAGLLVVRAYQEANNEGHRNVCLIPTSAHGTNAASAVMAGLKVVPVACDEDGNIDFVDLKKKAEQHQDALSVLMITYPSTHGVFEEHVQEVAGVVHQCGGQVYLDGANLNAQVGLCRPGDLGADVCHVNLHKTFCIPHGGGGPGMGPIAVQKHLAPYLPGHPLAVRNREQAIGPVSAAEYGSPNILPISWAYIAMMGAPGLKKASQVAILNANYMAEKLKAHYAVLYRGKNGRVAHEFVIDLRPFKKSAGIEVEDVAKRLIDYGFHAPTMSWPVAGTLMIEPTESESRSELDRFVAAMIGIRSEIRAIEEGRADKRDNPLKNAPHTAEAVTAEDWTHGYTRQEAAFPLPWIRAHKYWSPVARVDNAFGDRNLVCTCPPMQTEAD